MGIAINPSILSADFTNLERDLQAIATADAAHVDVMDNHFVPNLTLGPVVVDSLLQVANIPMDCHLMITDPGRWAPGYAEAGAHNVTFHVEAADDPSAVARDIRAAGGKAGLAIKPGTSLDPYLALLPDFDTLLIMSVEPGFGGQKFIEAMLPKIAAAKAMIADRDIVLEVDGGIGPDNVGRVVKAGCEAVVAGSSVFGQADKAAAVKELLKFGHAEVC